MAEHAPQQVTPLDQLNLSSHTDGSIVLPGQDGDGLASSVAGICSQAQLEGLALSIQDAIAIAIRPPGFGEKPSSPPRVVVVEARAGVPPVPEQASRANRKTQILPSKERGTR